MGFVNILAEIIEHVNRKGSETINQLVLEEHKQSRFLKQQY
jgi:hypothetical protein